MQIQSEADILNIEVRKKIIADIEGTENQRRKIDAFKRYEIYKDQTFKYVEDLLLRQFDPSTVDEMKYSIANLSMVRKIIDKKSRVYSNGVVRELPKKRETEKLLALTAELSVDQKMKKANRFLELFKNTMIYVKPQSEKSVDGEFFKVKLMVMAPFLYDVVEDPDDKERPLCVITSNFVAGNTLAYSSNPGVANRGFNTPGARITKADGKDQTIADTPFDGDPSQKKQYIWWSDTYHFTTDNGGEVVSGPEIENPIGELPFVNFAKDQDDNFWALGGDDLIDGSLLINSMISNTNHIGVTQGYGQPFMTGSNLPQRVKVGPNFLIKLEQKDGEPQPTFGFATANPPLSQLKEMIVMYIALILSTNDLSTSGVKVDLQSGSDFASGVALMIDKSELIETISDQVSLFKEKEIEVWALIFKWIELYRDRGLLVEDFKDFSFTDRDVSIKFNDPKPNLTEKDKLESLKLREELGINTMVDLLKIDNPDLSDQEAEQKLQEILQEKMNKMAQFKIQGGQDGINGVPVDQTQTEAQVGVQGNQGAGI